MQTDVLSTSTFDGRRVAVETAVDLLRKGDVVALPTETVYGLAADALKSEAVAKIFAAKERPHFDPLIVHLPDSAWLDRVARIDSDQRELVDRLSAQFWPGPLTVVLSRREIVPDLVTAGLDTVALRISAHPLFQEIIQRFDSPLAAPSANRFGRVSPTTATHVADELAGRIPLIVDAGPTIHGIESTIIALRNGRIELLRRGPITSDQLEALGDVVVSKPALRPDSPGQLPSHYSPSTPLVLVEDANAFHIPPGKRCGLLAWRSDLASGEFVETRQLSSRRDLVEAAANLFRLLREMDELQLDFIVAERVPDHGLGAAINDRLSRAAR